ncbi:Uncharacterised protein [uncultured archaeon]|nr:Uncharacterised protein [uncultured archaeon]
MQDSGEEGGQDTMVKCLYKNRYRDLILLFGLCLIFVMLIIVSAT